MTLTGQNQVQNENLSINLLFNREMPEIPNL